MTDTASREIRTDDYCVSYDEPTQTVACQGSLRLSGMAEYEPIVDLLSNVADTDTDTVVLDLTDLEFLNSSGISMLSKFVIKVRHRKTVTMSVRGSRTIPWQGKSLKNLQRLMPSLDLQWD
jgi:hypothetical protein